MKTRSLLLAMSIVASAGASAHAETISVTAFGGAWEQAFRECYVAPYEAATGNTAEVTVGSPSQWVNQIAANPQDPPIDVLVNLMDTAAVAIKDGLVDPMTVEQVPNLAKVPAAFTEPLQGYGTVINFGAAGLGYMTDRVPNPPADWMAFFDGIIAGDYVATLPGINVGSTTPTALLWNLFDLMGVPLDKTDAVMEKLVAMKDSGNLVFYNDMNQYLTQLQSGEADIGIYWDGRAWTAKDGGIDKLNFYYPQPGGIISPSVIQKVKNGSDEGWNFINVLLSKSSQECFSQKVGYPVVNQDVVYPEPLASRVPSYKDVRWPDFAGISKVMPEWVDQWNRTVGR
ncbi:MAG: extracellular solute-binding protein [Rhodobiaceae bacterium]|nr:extracellular solute-binding protein [Rhodobiaceae bacterium]MCC0048623.1 extracellular solute-binding protein [Rhodobiaceae bacterium]